VTEDKLERRTCERSEESGSKEAHDSRTTSCDSRDERIHSELEGVVVRGDDEDRAERFLSDERRVEGKGWLSKGKRGRFGLG
jgi:phage terminase small subunit